MKKWHLWLAASIGLLVIVGMMIREFDVEVLSRIDLSPRFFLGVVMGVLLFAVQNLMLTLRFRHLCQRKLSVAEAFRINVLCEFTSAVTPSAVGGSGLAFVYLNREGVSMGRSIFTMFAALLADEAFLAISCVLLYFCVPSHLLFSLADGVGISVDATNEWIKGGVQAIFIVSTLIVAVDFHSESYAWRKWRGRVDVPPLLCRFPARCLSSHPCRHALARHLLLPFPGDGHPGLAEMDC